MGVGNVTTIIGLVVLLCFITQCLSSDKPSSDLNDPQCPQNKLKIVQIGKVNNKIEQQWDVTITNECPCTLLNLKLNCLKFNPGKKTDLSVISKYDDSHCLVNNGQPLHGAESVQFKYVGAKATFTAFDYWVACS